LSQNLVNPVKTTGASSVSNVCHYFLQGYCARGNQCKYAHLVNINSSVPMIQNAAPVMTDYDYERVYYGYGFATSKVGPSFPSLNARAKKATAVDGIFKKC
jgi:hypothetical protein